MIAFIALLPGIVTSGNAQYLEIPAEAFQGKSSWFVQEPGTLPTMSFEIRGVDQLYRFGAAEAPFYPNELIVEPPDDPEDLAIYGIFIQQIEGIYQISIQTQNLNPSGIGSKEVEKHYWEEDLGPQATQEIADLYLQAGYRVHLSHVYMTSQMDTGNNTGDPSRRETKQEFILDSLLGRQVPYPLGDDDDNGYVGNEGGYLRALYANWPPEGSAGGDILLVVSDTGLFWRFEDFIANLWQNPGEDLNGNGTIVEFEDGSYDFDLSDMNGTDDDGNGYEDLIGYDFFGGTPDPTHYDGEFFTHGTSVYSVIGSETFNGIEMAGVLFPGYVKVVPTKVGMGLMINEAAAVEGIYYACYLQAQGYRVVLNMSWGGRYESEPLRYALDTFADMGGLAVAAVGNEPDGLERYPAAWPSVIAVSASTMFNCRAYFSNFGFWVDLAAPGEGILAAYYFATAGFRQMYYAPMEGTSFASPMVSSLAAMYWSVNPDLAASEVRDRLFASVYTPEDYPWDPPHTWPDGMFRINDPPGGDVGDPYYGVGILDSYLLFGS
jgi:subtilisin family serine protease